MKKLLLGLLLCFSLSVSTSVFAQERKEFIKTYTQMHIKEDGIDKGWFSSYCKVYYNYGNDSNKVRILVGTTAMDLKQIGETITGSTVGGYEYQAMSLVNITSSDEVLLQLFESSTRLIFDENNIIELGN